MLFFWHVHPGQASPKGGGDTRKTLPPLQPSCMAACKLRSGDKVEAHNVSESVSQLSQLPMEDVHATKTRNFKAHTTLSRGNSSTHEWLPSVAHPKKPFSKVVLILGQTWWNHMRKRISKLFAGKAIHVNDLEVKIIKLQMCIKPRDKQNVSKTDETAWCISFA